MPRAGTPAGFDRDAVIATAVTTARLRAQETARPDRLVNDPYAARLVAAARAAGVADGGESPCAVADQVAIRTRFYDEYLLTARSDGCTQVVILGAGLDFRGFRLSWPWPTSLFELDLPELIELKERTVAGARLTARCSRTVVGVDLREDWWPALANAGFRPELPTAWLVEGLLVYLPAEDAAELLRRVSASSAPHSRLATEFVDPLEAALLVGLGGTSSSFLSAVADPVGGREAAVPAQLDRLGWTVDVFGHRELGRRYGRVVHATSPGGYLIARRNGAL